MLKRENHLLKSLLFTGASLCLGSAVLLTGCQEDAGGGVSTDVEQAADGATDAAAPDSSGIVTAEASAAADDAADPAPTGRTLVDTDGRAETSDRQPSTSDRAAAADRVTTDRDRIRSAQATSDRDRALERRERLAGEAAAARGDGEVDRELPDRSERRAARTRELVVTAEPTVLELGEVPTHDKVTGTIRLTNTGEEPRLLTRCKTSCGCTAAACPENSYIEPGESIEVEISVSGGARPHAINKTVTFQLQGQPPLTVPVKAVSVSYVAIEPEELDADASESAALTLASVDGEPFRVVAVNPPVITDLPIEPQAEHTLQIDWDKWRELGEQQYLRLDFDHPRCTQAMVTVTSESIRQRLEERRRERTRLLAERRRNPDTSTTVDRTTPISVVIKRGDVEELTNQLKNGDLTVEYRDEKGVPLISQVARHGTADMLKTLIDAGADIEAADRTGRTPLMTAPESKDAEMVRVLLDAGAAVDAKDSLGLTALSWAAGFGDVESVRTLIDAGAEVNVSGGTMGFTPLIWASWTGQVETVQALIDAGADLEARDKLQSGTALMKAAQAGRNDNLQALLKAGAKLDARDSAGKTTLLIAAEASGANAATLQILLDAGADPNATDASGRSALELAQRRTDPRAQEVLALLKSVVRADAGDHAASETTDQS